MRVFQITVSKGACKRLDHLSVGVYKSIAQASTYAAFALEHRGWNIEQVSRCSDVFVWIRASSKGRQIELTVDSHCLADQPSVCVEAQYEAELAALIERGVSV
jgi:hypothetical protein